MNSSQPVPSLLCLGSLVSSPNTLPSVWGGSRAGGSWLVSGYFLEEEGKEKWATLQGLLLQKLRACHCSERKELVWHYLLRKLGVGLERRVSAGALEFGKRRSRTLARSRSICFYSIQIHHMHSHIHTYTGTGFDSKICEFLKWHSQ